MVDGEPLRVTLLFQESEDESPMAWLTLLPRWGRLLPGWAAYTLECEAAKQSGSLKLTENTGLRNGLGNGY